MDIVKKNGRLNPYAAGLIRKKARELVGSYGLTESDREDIEQELWMELITRQDRYDPAKGAETTFIAMVVRHGIASLVERRKAQKRDCRTTVVSLDETIDLDDEEGLLRHEVVRKDDYLRNTQESVRYQEEIQDLHVDVKRAIESLPPRLRKIALLLTGLSVTDVARVTGIPRTTISDMRRTIGRVFEEQGIGDWLP